MQILMKYSLVVAVGLTLLAFQHDVVNASIIRVDSIESTGTIINTFQDLNTRLKDGLVFQTGARYGEHFAGQTIDQLTVWDLVGGVPSVQLDLLVGAPSENLTVASDKDSRQLENQLEMVTSGQGSIAAAHETVE